MNQTAVPVLETTLQKTHSWLKDLASLMGWVDQHQAYLALRAVLHALRDRLPVEIVAKLGAQLPMLIRGIYYEGWVPAHTPIKAHNLPEFLKLVTSKLGNELLVDDVELITENVFRILKNYISNGEVEHLKKALPEPIASLFPPF